MSTQPFKWYHANSEPIQRCIDRAKRFPMTADNKEWVAELEQARAKGHVFMLSSGHKKCPGWTPQRGCPGHAEPLESFKVSSERNRQAIESAIEAAATSGAVP